MPPQKKNSQHDKNVTNMARSTGQDFHTSPQENMQRTAAASSSRNTNSTGVAQFHRESNMLSPSRNEDILSAIAASEPHSLPDAALGSPSRADLTASQLLELEMSSFDIEEGDSRQGSDRSLALDLAQQDGQILPSDLNSAGSRHSNTNVRAETDVVGAQPVERFTDPARLNADMRRMRILWRAHERRHAEAAVRGNNAERDQNAYADRKYRKLEANLAESQTKLRSLEQRHSALSTSVAEEIEARRTAQAETAACLARLRALEGEVHAL